jgi:septal ring factor EnvC (AmiA/AmiB activator)
MKFKLLFFALLLTTYAHAGNIADEIVRSDSHLSNLREMIGEEQKAIQKLTNEKQKAASELKKAEIELNYRKKLAKKLEERLVRIKQEEGTFRFRQNKLTYRQEQLTEQIKAANLYLAGAGETEMLEALILSDELSDLAAGLQIISRVNAKLYDMVKEVEANKLMLIEAEIGLKQKNEEVTAALAEKNEAVRQFEAKRLLVKQLHKSAVEDEIIKKEYISLLESKQQELENKIKSLQTAKKKKDAELRFEGLEKKFQLMKGQLPHPVRGEVTESFGTKKIEGFKGVVHKKGIKIAPTETEVSSVYDGVVIHTDTAWGLGWFVIVEHHGGYYTLYANLDEILVNNNQRVHTGEILGRIDVDRDENTPYLYFEIRIHDKAVDPEGWLSS